jgi:hypothetical protein
VAEHEFCRACRRSVSRDVRARDGQAPARRLHRRQVSAQGKPGELHPMRRDLQSPSPIHSCRYHTRARGSVNTHAGWKTRRGTYANGTLRSMGASSHPFPSVLHRSINARQTREHTSIVQFHAQRWLVPGVPQNMRRSGREDEQPAAPVHTITSAQRLAHSVRASCDVSVSHTSSASYFISHVKRLSLGDPASTCAGSTVCACAQSDRTTASFIATLERECGARSTSDRVCEGVS